MVALSRYKLHSRGLTYTVKKVTDFPVSSRDVTDKTLLGGEKFNYSRPEKVYSVTFLLGTGK
jgi:hypothetical protein